MSGENEPITVEWLRSVGFTYERYGRWYLWSGLCCLTIEILNGHAATSIYDGDALADIPAGLCPKTRGDVVRLCVALGFGEALTAEARGAISSAESLRL